MTSKLGKALVYVQNNHNSGYYHAQYAEDGIIKCHKAKIHNIRELFSLISSVDKPWLKIKKTYLERLNQILENLGDKKPKDTLSVLWQEIIENENLFISEEVYHMNCDCKSPYLSVSHNAYHDKYILNHHEDITIKFNRISEFNKDVHDFFGGIENGFWLLYYLNKFRHNERIPAVLLFGEGGSGKSVVLSYFQSYKEESCKSFFKENFTGNFGATSLIIDEETSSASAKNFDLNVLKDLATNDIHSTRKMYSNPAQCKGHVTMLFSCNDNQRSLMMKELNKPGEDVASIKRRMSFFAFDKKAKENTEKIISNGGKIWEWGRRTEDYQTPTVIDKHLNYLEDNKIFEKMETEGLSIPDIRKSNIFGFVVDCKNLDIGSNIMPSYTHIKEQVQNLIIINKGVQELCINDNINLKENEPDNTTIEGIFRCAFNKRIGGISVKEKKRVLNEIFKIDVFIITKRIRSNTGGIERKYYLDISNPSQFGIEEEG
jgi:hypothetical protein